MGAQEFDGLWGRIENNLHRLTAASEYSASEKKFVIINIVARRRELRNAHT